MSSESQNQDRREFLKKAAWTAPKVIALGTLAKAAPVEGQIPPSDAIFAGARSSGAEKKE